MVTRIEQISCYERTTMCYYVTLLSVLHAFILLNKVKSNQIKALGMTFKVDFGVNGAIGTIVTKWDLIVFGQWIVFIHNIFFKCASYAFLTCIAGLLLYTKVMSYLILLVMTVQFAIVIV